VHRAGSGEPCGANVRWRLLGRGLQRIERLSVIRIVLENGEKSGKIGH
jgi:hypothetical protein